MYTYSYFLSLEVNLKVSLLLCLLNVIYFLVSLSSGGSCWPSKAISLCVSFLLLCNFSANFSGKLHPGLLFSTSWRQTGIYRLGKLWLQTVHAGSCSFGLVLASCRILTPDWWGPGPSRGFPREAWCSPWKGKVYAGESGLKADDSKHGEWVETDSVKDDATGNARRWVSHISSVFLRHSVTELTSGMVVQILFSITIALLYY